MARTPPVSTQPASRPIILLTGFGPFPGVPVNASQRLVKALARRARPQFPQHDVTCAILHTEWQRAPHRVAMLAHRLQPVLTLHFGVASGSTSLRIERHAANACRIAPDAAGHVPRVAELMAAGEARHAVTIPVDAVYQTLAQSGIPVSLSDDAGGYLCNAVLYHSLSLHARAERPGRVGFIHLPDDLSRPPLTFSVALNACLEIIEACLGADHPSSRMRRSDPTLLRR